MGNAHYVLDVDRVGNTIHPNIYGHFAEHLGRCIYGGLWVGEQADVPHVDGIRRDVLEALRDLPVPVLRWPGGCFADEYHWKQGVGPREERPSIVNTHWGGVVENNHFGTHEFLHLCGLLGAEPYISGNVGSGTVQEMQEWVEYITFPGRSPMADWRRANGRDEPWRLKYFGVGNENWGCGGHMRPEYYADVYRQFQTYVRNFGDNQVYKIACGASSGDYRWTEVLMREAASLMDGLSLHYYTVPGDWEHKGSACGFSEDEWFVTLQKTLHMDELIRRHSTIMDRFDPDKRVGMIVDEWGAWYDVEPGTNPGFLFQQNTLRDALVAALNLNLFHHHCERVHMANLAQTVNVLQSVILTDERRMVKTPTYHVFSMYKVHQGAVEIPLYGTGGEYCRDSASIPHVHASASRDPQGQVHLSLCNLHHEASADVAVELRGAALSMVSGQLLTADRLDAHNTWEAPNAVAPRPFTQTTVEAGTLRALLPPASVAVLTLEEAEQVSAS